MIDDGLVYSALLTPQGKYMADFFVVPLEDAFGIDVHADLAQTLLERFNIYKLRSDVEIKELEVTVALGLTGVDFKKGCYVGQEVTARMKHKTELHKGLVKIGSEQTMVNGEELFLNDKPIGSVLTVYDRSALAYVRLKNRDEILSTKSTKRIFVDKNPIPSN